MTLHQNVDFKDMLRGAAVHFKMRPVFVEKDYWVTYVLKNISVSPLGAEVIFKGGTSLSKAYQCIERFSEDVDLAILKTEDISNNQLTNKIKAVEQVSAQGLEYFKHENEEKKGRNRRTFYHYTKVLDDQNFGPIKDHIQLEINTFTNPVPHHNMLIGSYVGQFLKEIGQDELIKTHGMEAVPIKVLNAERTFYEKLLSLTRLSYDGPEKLRGKIRHFYDLHKLLHAPDFHGKILIPENFEIIDLCKKDDRDNAIFNGDWLDQPLTSSPLLADIGVTWGHIEQTYLTELPDLIWDNAMPTPAEIIASLESIKEFLVAYDKK
jgi:predicted nucleotidyltransferase component of viral defense system